MSNNGHLSDQSLLLFADGEFPLWRASKVRVHLAACWECRARMGEIETAIANFVRCHRESVEPEIPPIAGPRALLKAQLAELARNSNRSRLWRLRTVMNVRVPAYIFALVFFLAVGSGFLYERNVRNENGGLMSAYSDPLPNPRLTPGFVRPAALADICSADHDEVVRQVPTRMQEEVYREYGIAGAPTSNYEVDYLVTPGLGGADDIRNLWPEPHYNTVWNSYVKDHLEDHLHYMVCTRQITLVAAQQDMETNWIVAYQKYFHTDKPLTNYAGTSSPASSASTDDMPPTVPYLSAIVTWDEGRRSTRLWNAIASRKLLAICSAAFLPGLPFLMFVRKRLPFRERLTREMCRSFLAALQGHFGIFDSQRSAQDVPDRTVHFMPGTSGQCASPVKSL